MSNHKHSNTRSASRSSTRRERPAEPANTVTATFEAVLRIHQRGFGFAAPHPDTDTPLGTESAFVPPALLAGMCADDLVSVVANQDKDGRWTATEVGLVARHRTEIFGVVVRGTDGLVLEPDPFVATGTWVLSGPAHRPGTAVLCALSNDRGTWIARPTESFPDAYAPLAIRRRVLSRLGLPSEAPEMPGADPIDALAARDDAPARRDLRGLVTITIDDSSSMDLDDALSVFPADAAGAIRVLVHIADVAEAVRPGETLDDIAFQSCTSVYFPGWNRPMLPRRLSEDLLSLVPGADRNTLTAELRIAPDGEVQSCDLFESVIRSDCRLSYGQASELLAGSDIDWSEVGVPATQGAEIAEAMSWLRAAAARLGVQRARRGGIDSRRIEPEREVTDVDGALAERPAKQTTPADTLIERLMVQTNESVALWQAQRGVPTLHRVHDGPAAEMGLSLEAFATSLGLHPGLGNTPLSPTALSAFAAQVDLLDDDRASAMWDVLVSKLGRARYQQDRAGHFSLGSQGYAHFTSPIRRYADLEVHRMVKRYLRGDRDFNDDLTTVAAACNERAWVAKRAESAVRRTMSAASLAGTDWRSGIFKVRITGFSQRGAFVSVTGCSAGGFLPYRALGARYELDEHELTATAAGSSKSGLNQLTIGQQLDCKISALDVIRTDITLELAPKAAITSPG